MNTYTQKAQHNKIRSTWLLGTLKIGVAACIILVIGLAIVTLQPEGEVKESQADIADLKFLAPPSATQRFVRALDDLGHEAPRTYDFNGNHVYFSTRTSNSRPGELFDEYQRAFKDHGLNKKAYKVPSINTLKGESEAQLKSRIKEVHEAKLAGEVMPLKRTSAGFEMGGASLKRGIKKPKHFSEVFGHHRHVQATWLADRRQTVVTASWSDENFDVRKTLRPEQGGTKQGVHGFDADIPVCLGCERTWHFASVKGDRPYKKQIFESTQMPANVAQFYRQTMPRRGWKQNKDAHKKGLHVDAVSHVTWLQFNKDNDVLTMAIYADDKYGKTIVHAFKGD